MTSTRLYDLAHARTGDKGNHANISLIAYRAEDYPLLVQQVTCERVAQHFGARQPTQVRRYLLPRLGAINFVLDDVLDGGVNDSLNLDMHGKSLSFHLLEMRIDAQPIPHATQAATRLATQWQARQHLDTLPADCRPATRTQGYAVQALWPAIAGPIGGWKIAATSVAGQRHIGVSGPLAGPVFARRVVADGATVSLAANRMRVAECEVVFTFKRALDPRPQPWSRHDVLEEVAQVLPGIEVPDSRFLQFERAGEAQLIADCACCNDMVLGAPLAPADRLESLVRLAIQARVSDGRILEGVGSNALGDPVEALRWFVNEMSAVGQRIEAHHFLTTGTCVTPIPVEPGQSVQVDFGWLGQMTVHFD